LFIPVAGEEPVVAPVIAQVNTLTEQLSAVVGLGVTTLLEQVPAVTVLVMFAGHVMVGTVVSTLFTLKVQVAVFPAASVAVSVITVVPTKETEEPIAGDCVTTIEAVGVQLSLTVASEV
jgi:hypothetical protein